MLPGVQDQKSVFKGTVHSKNAKVYAKESVPVCYIQHTGHVFFFCKLLLNGASYGSKIGSIQILGAGAKKYQF